MSLTGVAEGKAASLNMLDLRVCWSPVGENPSSLIPHFCCMATTCVYIVVMVTTCVYIVVMPTTCVTLLWLQFVFTLLSRHLVVFCRHFPRYMPLGVCL